MARADETQYRVLMWSGDSGAAERLAAQVLLASGFEDPDPSHPYGGPDGGRDAVFTLDGATWVMAAYFPHGDKPFSEVKTKFTADVESAKKHKPKGVAFVTNQEITLGERKELMESVSDVDVEIFHMEKVAALLDQPRMVGTRQQFLGIDPGTVPLNLQLTVHGKAYAFTGGEELREVLLDSDATEIRDGAEAKRNASQSDRLRLSFAAQALGQGPPSPPPTPEEVEALIEDHRSVATWEWPRIEDYVAGFAFSPINFTVTNVAESFLYDVKIVVTFAAAHGVEPHLLEEFESGKLLDPEYEPPRSLYDSMPVFIPGHPADYPIEWKNKNGNLEVRIALPELPPGKEFEWDGTELDDVILVASPETQSVLVRWTAVARGHGIPFVGPQLEVAVESTSMLESVHDILEQLSDDS